MTRCPSHDGGSHAFPYEDETGAYCEEHEIRLVRHVGLWRGDPITSDDLPAEAAPDESEE